MRSRPHYCTTSRIPACNCCKASSQERSPHKLPIAQPGHLPDVVLCLGPRRGGGLRHLPSTTDQGLGSVLPQHIHIPTDTAYLIPHQTMFLEVPHFSSCFCFSSSPLPTSTHAPVLYPLTSATAWSSPTPSICSPHCRPRDLKSQVHDVRFSHHTSHEGQEPT